MTTDRHPDPGAVTTSGRPGSSRRAARAGPSRGRSATVGRLRGSDAPHAEPAPTTPADPPPTTASALADSHVKSQTDRLLDEISYWRERTNENSLSWFQLIIGVSGAFVAGVTFAVSQQDAARAVLAALFSLATPIVVAYFSYIDGLSSYARQQVRDLERSPLLEGLTPLRVLPKSPPGIWPLFMLLVSTYIALDAGASLYAVKSLVNPDIFEALRLGHFSLPTPAAVAVVAAPGVISLALLAVIVRRARRDC